MEGELSTSEALGALPPVWPVDMSSEIRRMVAASGATLVVLDDDPTGTQTVHDVAVLTRWDVAGLCEELRRGPECFYILTNSRSLLAEEARSLTRSIAENLQRAAAAAGRRVVLLSRSDSTLRGHFPLETDVLAEIAGQPDATFLLFYFEAGGRYTIGDMHYVAEGDRLIPAAQTPFARDAAFGYTQSDLKRWVQEKTAGRIAASDVHSISIEQLRCGGPAVVERAVMALPRGAVCIVNSASHRDMQVFAAAVLAVEARGRRYLYRSAAGFVAARLGMTPGDLWRPSPSAGEGRAGGLVVVGSYVPKTTEQLRQLLRDNSLRRLELDVSGLLSPGRKSMVRSASEQVNVWLAAGEDVVVFTSRELRQADSAAGSLVQGREISRALVHVVRGLQCRPRFLVAKGGITSSDIATEALGIRRAVVLGQIAPGVPVWEAGGETRFAGLPYVIFPGNVGDVDTLHTVVQTLRRTKDNP